MKSVNTRVTPDEFVVRVPTTGDRSHVLGRITELGTVQPISAHPELVVLHLDKAGKGTAKGRWQKLRKAVGNAAVFPVFVDDTQSARFPVGTIQVRFKAPPTAAVLDQLALKHGLVVRGRNKYAPTQIAFTPPDDAYLPDLIEDIGGGEELEAVWPETLSAYQR